LIKVIDLFDRVYRSFYSLTWIHDSMLRIDFKPDLITEDTAEDLNQKILEMIDLMGIKKDKG
jgi:hypothetical protein